LAMIRPFPGQFDTPHYGRSRIHDSHRKPFTRRSRSQLRSGREFLDELPWVGMWGTTDTGRTGGMAVSKFARGCSAMSERHKRIHQVNTDFRAGEAEDETVITIETSPVMMPPAWVNFLKQRLHLLHLDCKQVGAGRIVVMSTPRAAESVARLVLSAMQCADHYFQTAVRNR